MKRLIHLICVCIALAFIAAPVRGETIRFSTNSYAVHTDLPAQEAKPFAQHMDAVFAKYTQLFKSFGEKKAGTMPLYIFRGQEAYQTFLAKHGINGANTGGMFFVKPTGQGLVVFTQGRSMTQVFAVLQHEGFHQFAFHYIGPQLPVWVNEGIAQYFEDGVLVGDQFHLGLANARRVDSVKNALRSERIIDFDTLLTVKEDQWHANVAKGGDLASLQYDQSWSMVFFLIRGDNGKYTTAFEKYLKAVSQQTPSDRAFRDAFGSRDTTAFRARWEEFAEGQAPDAVNVAIDRMEFLGEAMKFLASRNIAPPTSIDQLRAALVRIGFRITRTEPGRTTSMEAGDEDLYRFTLPGKRIAAFAVLPPEREGLLPRIHAPGLRPEPTLCWRRDSTGQMTAEVVFR